MNEAEHNYGAPKDRLFGQNIREAIAIVKGRATRQPEESEANATPENMDPIRMRDCVIADLREEIVEHLSLIKELRGALTQLKGILAQRDNSYFFDMLKEWEEDYLTAALARSESMKGDR